MYVLIQLFAAIPNKQSIVIVKSDCRIHTNNTNVPRLQLQFCHCVSLSMVSEFRNDKLQSTLSSRSTHGTHVAYCQWQ